MFTENQEMLYNELGSCIRRHFMENDLSVIEVIGIMDVIKTEVRDEAFMASFCPDIDEEDSLGL